MNWVIIGATGATGGHAVSQALAAGHAVTAVARRPADITVRHEKLTVIQGEATRAEDLEKVFPGHDAVLCAVGSRTRSANTVRSDCARAVVTAAKKASIRRVVWLSALGVGDSADQARRSSFVFGRIIMPLFLSAVFADSAVAESIVRDSGLDWVVVRPGELKNVSGTGRYEVVPLSTKVPRISIARADVAKFMLEQLTTDAHLRQCVTVC